MSYKCEIHYDWRDGAVEFCEVPDYENGVPADAYHGLVKIFPLACRGYDADIIVDEFKAEFGDELDMIREGFTVEWDGHNHVGRWEEGDRGRDRDTDIQMLGDRIRDWSERQGDEIWDASDYFHGGLTFEEIVHELKITTATTDDELDDIVTDALDHALAQGYKLEGMHKFAEHIRTQLLEDKDKE
jgi:hypothetical protein